MEDIEVDDTKRLGDELRRLSYDAAVKSFNQFITPILIKHAKKGAFEHSFGQQFVHFEWLKTVESHLTQIANEGGFTVQCINEVLPIQSPHGTVPEFGGAKFSWKTDRDDVKYVT
jgi:hypothetical protein